MSSNKQIKDAPRMVKAPSKFHEDLKFGQEAEALVARFMKWEQLDGRHSDFLTQDGEAIELKTDRRDSRTSPNVFLEVFSNLEKQSPGGPFQAFGRGSTLYAYYFAVDKRLFVYDTVKLLKHLEANKYKVHRILNRGWITTGVAVPRSNLDGALIGEYRVYKTKTRS